MDFITNHWYVLVIIIAALGVAGYAIYTFVKMPSNQQLTKVQEWLLYAVTKAEQELGAGTGQLKLRYVYDMFVGKFPDIAKVLTFEAFSIMVDTALEKFKKLLETNQNVAAYVEKDE